MPPAKPILWAVLTLFLIVESVLGIQWIHQLRETGLVHAWTILTDPFVMMTLLDFTVFAVFVLVWMYHDARLRRRRGVWAACLPLFVLTPAAGLMAYLLAVDPRRANTAR